MMSDAVLGALVGALAWIFLLYDENPRLAPDSLYYQALQRLKPVPAPFCGRWLAPLVLFHPAAWHIGAAVACVMTTAIAADVYGIAGALLWVGLPAGPRFWARHPVLVDPLAALLLWMFVVTPADGPEWWGHVLMLGAAREQLPLVAAVMHADPWWLVGSVMTLIGYVWLRRPAGAIDNAWIRRPWETTLAARRGQLFDARLLIVPWGAILPLALLVFDQWTWQTWAVLAIGYLPILRSSDTARCYLWAAPAMIALAVTAPVPALLWPVVLVAHLLNPYRGA